MVETAAMRPGRPGLAAFLLPLLLAAAIAPATPSPSPLFTPAAPPPTHPHLVYSAALLAKTWGRLAVGGSTAGPLRGALARVEAEARAHLAAGPFSVVTSSGAVPPSGDRHDYTSVGVYWWPCARGPGLGPCDPTTCAHATCNCSSAEVCGKTGAHCDAKTGLPWQSCDGHENKKQIAAGGLPQLASMAAAVKALAAGFYWTRNASYADRAVLLIATFFLDEATAMNPNFDYAQSLGQPCSPPACPAPGVPAGSGSGLVEIDVALVDVLEAIALLTRPAPCHGEREPLCEGSSAWTAHHDANMTGWVGRWARWMKATPFSTWACNYANNHNADCRGSWLAVSLWAGDPAMAAALISGAKEPQWTNATGGGDDGMPYQLLGGRDCAGCNGACTGTCGKAPIGGQIDAAGFLPYESTRVNSVGYTTAELRNLYRLAQLSRAAEVRFGRRGHGSAGSSDAGPAGAGAGGMDLFAYTSKTGGQSSVRGALDYLVPFALGRKIWPRPTETTTWAIFPELRMAAAVFSNSSYATWASSAEVQSTGCLDVGLANCSDSDAVLWWPL